MELVLEQQRINRVEGGGRLEGPGWSSGEGVRVRVKVRLGLGASLVLLLISLLIVGKKCLICPNKTDVSLVVRAAVPGSGLGLGLGWTGGVGSGVTTLDTKAS